MVKDARTPWNPQVRKVQEDKPLQDYVYFEDSARPTVNTGIIDLDGNWRGIQSSDKYFSMFTRDEAIPNTGEILTPSTNPDGTWPLDMTGFNDLFIALKPTNGGDYAIQAVMGPDTLSFANLNPISPASLLKGLIPTMQSVRFDTLVNDPADALTADVWNIFYIKGNLANQKLLQFKITNNSGGETTIECAFMRLV